MGFAVNASAMGMAISSLAVAFFSQRIDRRHRRRPEPRAPDDPDLAPRGRARSDDLHRSCGSRRGSVMAAAFTLTLAYLGERCTGPEAATAFAAYITGNVASNFLGRLMSAGARRSLRPGDELLRLRRRSTCAGRCSSTLRSSARLRCEAPPAALVRDGRRARRAPAQPRASCGLRDWLLYPLRLHRRLHIREFRPRSAADRHRHDGRRLRLFRLSALHVDHPDRGPFRQPLRRPDDHLGRLDRRPDRLAIADRAEPRCGCGRFDVGGSWDFLCTGGRDELRRACRERPIAARRAASTSPRTSPAVSSAARFSARSSIGSAGRPALQG